MQISWQASMCCFVNHVSNASFIHIRTLTPSTCTHIHTHSDEEPLYILTCIPPSHGKRNLQGAKGDFYIQIGFIGNFRYEIANQPFGYCRGCLFNRERISTPFLSDEPRPRQGRSHWECWRASSICRHINSPVLSNLEWPLNYNATVVKIVVCATHIIVDFDPQMFHGISFRLPKKILTSHIV